MQSKYTLGEERIPKRWCDIAADLPQALPAVLHPGTLMPGGKLRAGAVCRLSRSHIIENRRTLLPCRSLSKCRPCRGVNGGTDARIFVDDFR